MFIPVTIIENKVQVFNLREEAKRCKKINWSELKINVGGSTKTNRDEKEKRWEEGGDLSCNSNSKIYRRITHLILNHGFTVSSLHLFIYRHISWHPDIDLVSSATHFYLCLKPFSLLSFCVLECQDFSVPEAFNGLIFFHLIYR